MIRLSESGVYAWLANLWSIILQRYVLSLNRFDYINAKGLCMNGIRALIMWSAGVGLAMAGCAPEPAGRPWRIDSGALQALSQGGATKPPDLQADASLEDMLVFAALNNPALEAAFNRWKAALEQVPQVQALPDPRFTYKYFIEEVETRVGAQRQSFTIAQMFPWLGKLALRGDAAAAAAQAQRRRYEAARLKLFYKVKQAYYEYYYIGKAVRVTQDNMKLLKHIEAVARTRYTVGAVGHSDVIRAQVELGKLDDRLRSLEEFRRPIVARLNAALNRATAAPLDWPEKIPEERLAIEAEQLHAMLAETNPDLKAMDFEISRRKINIDLAKKNYFPDVTLGATYIDTAGRIGATKPKDDGQDPVIVSASVNLPIWREKLSAGVRQARRLYWSALRERKQKANSLDAELKMVVYKFQDAQRKVNLYRDTLLPKARESLKVTEASFRAGKASFIDLIDSQRVLLEFELAYERGLADKAQGLAELEMIVGRDLPRGTNSAPAGGGETNRDTVIRN